MKKLFWVVAILAFFATACGGGSSSDNGGGGGSQTAIAGLASCTAQSSSGVVCGKALAADGTTPLAGAEIRLSDSSANLATLTAKGVADSTKCLADAAGDFACVVPSDRTGNVSFVIIFAGFENRAFTAVISIDSATDASNQTMTASTATKWVVVPGTFDGVQVLLAQLKGCTLNDMSGEPFDSETGNAASARYSQDCFDKGLLVLDDSDTSSQYYVSTFLTGSSLSGYDALFANCEADYSSEDGVDAAVQNFSSSGKHVYFSDRSDTWLTSAFPNVITFAGRDTNSGIIPASVVDANLATVIGNSVSIVFDLPVWTAVDSVTSAVTTFIQGDISSVSDYTGTHPITVGWKPASSSGCVFFTSYHIEGASTGASQELAIKYLIQNITSVCQ